MFPCLLKSSSTILEDHFKLDKTESYFGGQLKLVTVFVIETSSTKTNTISQHEVLNLAEWHSLCGQMLLCCSGGLSKEISATFEQRLLSRYLCMHAATHKYSLTPCYPADS